MVSLKAVLAVDHRVCLRELEVVAMVLMTNEVCSRQREIGE